MDIVYVIVGVLVVGGLVLAAYERRAKRTVLKHDLNLDAGPQTETDREAERARQALNDAPIRPPKPSNF